MSSNRPSENRIKKTTLFFIALTAVFSSSCTTVPKPEAANLRPLAGQEIPRYETDDLSGVSEEMAGFLDKYILPSMSDRQRTWQLALITGDKYILGFKYNPSITLPPGDTFEGRTGNCLAFSLMLMAMARHAGIPAQLQEVVLPPEFSSENATFINSRHINVVLGRGELTYVVDVSGKDISRSVRTRPISRSEAEAQYYNNLGVGELLDGDLPAAWARFQQAIEIDPNPSYLWSNLGVVYNRSNQVEDAEWAYQIAISSFDNDSSALYNLYVIYQQEERWLEAARLEQKVDRHRRQNPYYLAILADEAVRSRKYNEAIALLKRSIRINRKEYRFHGAMAQAQFLAGNHDKARNSLDTARSLAPTNAEDLDLPFDQN